MRMLTPVLIAVLTAPIIAGNIYVTTGGSPGGDGTQARPLDIATAVSEKSPAKPGDTILIAAGTYAGEMTGIERVPFAFDVSGTAEAPITIQPAPGANVHLNGVMKLTGSYLRIIGLEVGDLLWDPTQQSHKCDSALTAIGGEGTNIINCNFFGGAMGTGLWSPAKDITLYGCLVHDFGMLQDGSGRGHGHAFYAQNETGTKTIEQCLAYRGCGWNLHVYTQKGQIVGFDVIDNIMYIAGSRATMPQTTDNFLVAGHPGADRIRLIGNIGYQPSLASRYRPNVRLSNYKTAINGSGEVTNNCFMGAVFGLSLGNWKEMKVSGNTIWADHILMEINSAPTGSGLNSQPEKPDLAGYAVDHNTYIGNGHDKTFRYASVEQLGEEAVSFDEWKALGLDVHSQWIPGKDGRPAQNQAYVFGNKYEKGRGHIAVFNWEGKNSVSVNLVKILEHGQNYAIYNCIDITQTIAQAKPVLTGTYDSGDVTLPMLKSDISPDFDAFLVLPTP